MSKVAVSALTLILSVLPFASFGNDKVDASVEPTPLELFEQRIMPIFRSEQPASCIQCHLAAVDLKDYIFPSHEQTFVSLRDQGLIDLKSPEKSKILTLIRMGDKDLDKEAVLLHEKTRNAEFAAFAAWVAACCNDPKLRDLPPLAEAQWAKPAKPDAVIRHARMSRVVDSFVRNVCSQRMRCFPCHTPDEIDDNNPQHRVAVERHADYVEQYGDLMHLFRETPEATLQYWIENSRQTTHDELPLLNLEDPTKSLIVLKPTAKLPKKNDAGEFEEPSYAEPVSHMGGLKMHVDDPSYKAFVAWVRDYGNVVGNRYASVDELPADNWHATQHVLLIQDAPESWHEQSRVQLLIHAWDEEQAAWSAEPLAFTQNSLTPRRVVGGPLFLFSPASSRSATDAKAEAPTLPPGKYLIKAYVDTKHRLAFDPTMFLGADDFYGQVEIDAQWGKGFPEAQRIPGDRLK